MKPFVLLILILLPLGCGAEFFDFSIPHSATNRQVETIYTGIEVWGETGLRITFGGQGPSKIKFGGLNFAGGLVSRRDHLWGTYWIITLDPFDWDDCVADTVAVHEFGHVLGYHDDNDSSFPRSVMFVPVNECLNVRRLP